MKGARLLLGAISLIAPMGVAETPAPPSPQSRVLSPPGFERIVIDADFPGGYQVEVADVDGDRKPDIVALGGSTLAWYQNPGWKKRVISTARQTPDIISSATADLDGDGRAEIAVAYDFSMNEPKRGKLLLAIQGATLDDPWTFRPVTVDRPAPGDGPHPPALEPIPADVRSIHRVRWGRVLGAPTSAGGSTLKVARRPELVVAPIFGPSARPPSFDQEPAHLSVFDIGAWPKSGRWAQRPLGEAPTLHAIELVDLVDVGGPSTVLAASNRGISAIHYSPPPGNDFRTTDLVPGAPGDAPRKGSSEVHLGKFRDGRKFLAAVEPWHGTDVVIYASESPGPLRFGPRLVIDATLKEGHALWAADVDGDGDDEVFAGYRGGTGGVLMFDFDGKAAWARSVLDPGLTAQDLRGGDIDGDGTPDIVAIGGRSHEVVWFRPIRPAR